MTCSQEEVRPVAVSQQLGNNGPINPVGRLRMLHSSQTVGLYILPPANLGPLEMYPMPVVGARLHGPVGKWVSPWG